MKRRIEPEPSLGGEIRLHADIRNQEPILENLSAEIQSELAPHRGACTIGRKHILRYGLYRCEGFISAHLAERTGFSEDDLALLWKALVNMFDHDRSAARGVMAARKLIVFKHASKLGDAPAPVLFDAVKVERVSDGPASSFKDYAVTIDRAAIPAAIEVIEKL